MLASAIVTLIGGIVAAIIKAATPGATRAQVAEKARSFLDEWELVESDVDAAADGHGMRTDDTTKTGKV